MEHRTEDGADVSQYAGVALPFANAVVRLPCSIDADIRRIVSLVFAAAHSEAYAHSVGLGAMPQNFGVITGYDFHITVAGPSLIEVNTNAGGLLASSMHPEYPNPQRAQIIRLLPELFRLEFASARGNGAQLRSVAICDRYPESQFLLPEFNDIRDALSEAGIDCLIADTSTLSYGNGRLSVRGTHIDLVYLRDTDFLLETTDSAVLRAAFDANDVVVSPDPREYTLISHKARLISLSTESILTECGLSTVDARWLASHVPRVQRVSSDNESFWSRRGSLVFKPACGFGSKRVYRGDKISRATLGMIVREGFLAQDYVEPGNMPVAAPGGVRTMKYDVRAFAYRDFVIGYMARLYEGQVTNLRTPGGGFAPVIFGE